MPRTESMPSTRRRWRASQLVASCAAWWGALGVVTLSKPLMLAWRVTHLPDSAGGGDITGGLTNTVLGASISQNGNVLWSTSVGLFTLALWISGPPLVLLWLYLRDRRRSVAEAASQHRPAELDHGAHADVVSKSEDERSRRVFR